jgi:hypothetical protein
MADHADGSSSNTLDVITTARCAEDRFHHFMRGARQLIWILRQMAIIELGQSMQQCRFRSWKNSPKRAGWLPGHSGGVMQCIFKQQDENKIKGNPSSL